MSRSVLVEFVGLPGTGKSTLARAVMDGLRSRGVPVRDLNAQVVAQSRPGSVGRRAGLALRFSIAHPRLALESVLEILGTSQRRLGDARAVVTNWLCKCELMERAGAPLAIEVSDEGVLHAVWSLSYSARDRQGGLSAVERTIRAIRPDLWIVVHVDSSRAVSMDRLLNRAGPPNRLARDAQRDPLQALADAEAALNSTLALINRISEADATRGPEVIKVGNSMSEGLEDRADAICRGVMASVARAADRPSAPEMQASLGTGTAI